MSSNETQIQNSVTAEDFARLSTAANYIGIILIILSLITEIPSFILFLYHFKRKTQIFYTPYFYILSLGYFFNIGLIFIRLINTYISNGLIISTMAEVALWYNKLFIGFWGTMLALNRFTGLYFWKNQSIIWAGKYLMVIFALLLFYPLIINGYGLVINFNCYMNSTFSTECVAAATNITQTITISNCINSIIALILGLATALARKIKKDFSIQGKQKYETYLLIQSIFTAFFIFFESSIEFYLGVILVPSFQTGYTLNDIFFAQILLAGSGCIGYAIHFSSAIFLFLLSKSFREAFSRMFLPWMLVEKIYGKSSATSSSIAATTRSTEIRTIKITAKQ